MCQLLSSGEEPISYWSASWFPKPTGPLQVVFPTCSLPVHTSSLHNRMTPAQTIRCNFTLLGKEGRHWSRTFQGQGRHRGEVTEIDAQQLEGTAAFHEAATLHDPQVCLSLVQVLLEAREQPVVLE